MTRGGWKSLQKLRRPAVPSRSRLALPAPSSAKAPAPADRTSRVRADPPSRTTVGFEGFPGLK